MILPEINHTRLNRRISYSGDDNAQVGIAGAAAIAAAIAGAALPLAGEIVTSRASAWRAMSARRWRQGLIGWMARGTALMRRAPAPRVVSGLMRLCAGRAWGSGALMWLMSIAVSAAMTAAGGSCARWRLHSRRASDRHRVHGGAGRAVCGARVKLMGAVGAFTVAALIGYVPVAPLLCGVSPELPEYTWRPGAVLSAAAYAGFNIATACGAIFASGLRIKSDVYRRANALGAYLWAHIHARHAACGAGVRSPARLGSAAALPSA